jgi:ParB-like chromosome segregation protein Spo0J
MTSLNRTDLTLEDLKNRELSTDRGGMRPAALPRSRLTLAEAVFQWRKFSTALALEKSHVKELVRIIESSQKPLDPILVTVIGNEFYVIDGHHRAIAYHLAKWSSPVPVVYFEGSVEEARLEGLRLNIKNKLPMTRDDKFEAAWALVKEGLKYSKSEIVDMTSVSDGTVATMRRTLKEHPDTKDKLWAGAKGLQFESTETFDHDEWVEQKALKMAEQIMKNIGPELTQRPDVLALALEKIDENIPRSLIAEWRTLISVMQMEERNEEWYEAWHGSRIM